METGEQLKLARQTVINGLIERCEDLEEESGVDLFYTKRIILKFATRHKIFKN